MATVDNHQSSDPFCHSMTQLHNLILGDSIPLFLNCLTEGSHLGRTRIASRNSVFHPSPDLLDRIHVRRASGPWEKVVTKSQLFHPCHGCSSFVRGSVVLHEINISRV